MDVGFSRQEQEEMLSLVASLLESGYLMWGDMQDQLSAGFRELTGREHAVTLNSNTSIQEIVFAHLQPERVAFIGNQFPSPIFAAMRQGAKPTWVDIDPLTMAPSVEQLAAALPFQVLVLQETAGFVPRNIKEIAQWCRDAGVFLLEDAAQCVGAVGGDGPAGSVGGCGVFSLSGTKPMTSGGQGGMLVTDDAELAQFVFEMKNYGRTGMFQAGVFARRGWNVHMTELQAAIGVVALRHLAERTAERATFAAVYDDAFAGRLQMCGGRAGSPTWYKYPVLLPGGRTRASLREALAAEQIELSSSVYDEPSYMLPCFDGAFSDLVLPGVEEFCERHACLPCHHKMNVDDANRVVGAVGSWLGQP